MNLIIKLPKIVYERAVNGDLTDLDTMFICGAVADGKVILKGHGRLIDADKAVRDYAKYGIPHMYDAVDLEAIMNELPTVVESDEDEED